jgi:hypothetical protein
LINVSRRDKKLKLKIAIIGPENSLKIVRSVATEFDSVETTEMEYANELQTPLLIKESIDIVDVYLFYGPIPYQLGKDIIPAGSRSIFIPFEGTDLYRAIMEIYRFYHFFPVVSYDFIHPDNLIEVYNEIQIPNIRWHLKSIDEDSNSETLVEYHIDLWKRGEVQVIATCLLSIYLKLKELGVPVFHIKHTKQVIRETLKKAILMGNEQKKHEGQIAVLLLQIDRKNGEKTLLNRELYQEVKQRMLQYGNVFFSETTLLEEDIVYLFTTRGIVEKFTNYFQDLNIINEIRHSYPFTLSLGIGMGDTGESAVNNAKTAITLAKQQGGDCGYLIDEDKIVHGPLGQEHSLEYSLLNTKDSGFISITLRKFFSWLVTMRKKQVTSHEVRLGLNTSERHASRILKNLRDKGIAKVVGKESMKTKGRPRPIYEVDLGRLEDEISNQKKG